MTELEKVELEIESTNVKISDLELGKLLYEAQVYEKRLVLKQLENASTDTQGLIIQQYKILADLEVVKKWLSQEGE